jgi:hypothetical protein
MVRLLRRDGGGEWRERNASISWYGLALHAGVKVKRDLQEAPRRSQPQLDLLWVISSCVRAPLTGVTATKGSKSRGEIM